MPAFNAEAYIAEAVSSILEQSWRNLELIIVDDASTDSTADVVRGFSDPRIRLLTNGRNLGIAASTNRAVDASRGEFLALMDDDDVSLPDRLKAQVTFLENNRETMILGTGSCLIGPDGKSFGYSVAFPESPKYYQARLLIGNVEFCNSSAMIRKSFLKENNLSYREGCAGMQDYQFYMEASKHGAISCLVGRIITFKVCIISKKSSPSVEIQGFSRYLLFYFGYFLNLHTRTWFEMSTRWQNLYHYFQSVQPIFGVFLLRTINDFLTCHPVSAVN